MLTLAEMLQAMDQIQGQNGMVLPWEDAEKAQQVRDKLGKLKRHLIGLLARDPAERTSLEDFCRACARVFSSTSTITQPLSSENMVRLVS